MTRRSDEDLDYLLGDGPTVYTNEDIYNQLAELNSQAMQANSYLAAISGHLYVIVYAVIGCGVAYVVGKFWP